MKWTDAEMARFERLKVGSRVARSSLDVTTIPAGTLGRIVRLASPRCTNGYWHVHFDDGSDAALDSQYLEEVG
jgi:hypothetical protein